VPFVRKTSDLRGIEKLRLDYRFGDIRDYESVLSAAKGCDVIVHLATVYQLWAKDPNDIFQPALEGTRNIFRAAKECDIQRMVYTSSIVAVGYGRDPKRLRTEDDWSDDAKNPYSIAKNHSEKEAIRLSQEYNIPTIRLCPGFILGPYDYALSSSTRDIIDYLHGRNTTYEGGNSYVHVQDVAEAHVIAVEKGEPGGRYNVGGEAMHVKEFGQLIGKLTGVKPSHFSLTGRPAEWVGVLMAGISRLTGSQPILSREMAQDFVGRYGYLDSSRCIETFGIRLRSAEETLRDTIRWLLFLDKIKPQIARRIAADFPPDPEW
jgi:dihydroflavonol-4-reductase